jgi:uroporphyrinogen-III synthase
MSPPIIAIRPEPGCAATVEHGRKVGFAIEPWPLFEVRPLAWDPPPRDAIDGLLLGSANALRQGGPALDAFKGKRAYAVGRATAAAAEAAGLRVAAVGRGGLQPLLDTLRPPLRLLRLAGEEHVPLRRPLGIMVETHIVYRNAALPMPESLAETLRGGALVLLHSAAAARHLGAECDRLGIPRAAIAIAALGPRIVEAAGAGWRACRAAGEPRDAALLALAGDMCHDLPPVQG